MHKTTRNLFISAITILFLAGSISSQAIAGRNGGSGHGSKNRVATGQAMSKFDSNQSKIQQAPKNKHQFKHLEQEKRKLRNQRELLARNQNRIAQMHRIRVATQ